MLTRTTGYDMIAVYADKLLRQIISVKNWISHCHESLTVKAESDSPLLQKVRSRGDLFEKSEKDQKRWLKLPILKAALMMQVN